MPRMTGPHQEVSIVSFANDTIKILKENLNFDDIENSEEKPIIEYNGWYYYIHKSVINIKPELRVKRQNYRYGGTYYFKDQPKGNRINESAWIYKEGMNLDYKGKDFGFIIDGFSVQTYIKKVF